MDILPVPSRTHLVLIPSYNAGPLGIQTVQEARRFWNPVWIVVDGSTDGTAEAFKALGDADPGLRVMVLSQRGGKGRALRWGMERALAEGFTHALTMDSDGQHPAARIPDFMASSMQHPRSLLLGYPVFDASAPGLRVRGRRISNFWANLETLWAGIGDSLFGFRVYPIQPLLKIMPRRLFMQGFDFDPEAAVRLAWAGIPILNQAAEVRYLSPARGGISHFRYGRDNTLLTFMHIRLMLEFLLFRWPWVAWVNWQKRPT